MEFFDKIFAFISSFTHSIHSWDTIGSNLLAIAFVLYFRYSISEFYATLDGMNNSLSITVFCLSAITAYAFIYRSVSALFSAIHRFRTHKKDTRLLAKKKTLFLNSFLSLSNKEIATLKFILALDTKTAWLPECMTTVILLYKKGFITPFSDDRKQIPHKAFPSEIFPTARLFAPSDWTLDFLSNMPKAFSNKWKKVKPDFSLDELQ